MAVVSAGVTLADLHSFLDCVLSGVALPQHGSILIDFRDGLPDRVEVKTSRKVKDLTNARGMPQTSGK